MLNVSTLDCAWAISWAPPGVRASQWYPGARGTVFYVTDALTQKSKLASAWNRIVLRETGKPYYPAIEKLHVLRRNVMAMCLTANVHADRRRSSNCFNLCRNIRFLDFRQAGSGALRTSIVITAIG